MPFNVEAPMDRTYAPARYPSPSWTKDAEVRECWLPDEPTVGWLIIQDETALAWVSFSPPDEPAAYAVRLVVQETMQEALRDGLTCREAWNAVTKKALFRAPEKVSLADLSQRLQGESE